MAESLVRSRLHVEGPDDLHSITHLLIHNGIQYHPKEFDRSPHELPQIIAVSNITSLLAGMETTVSTNTNRTVGFLLDADSSLIDRWRAVSQKLRNVEVTDLPDRPPAEGFIGESSKYKTRVGVWLMPDNRIDGKLEDFLMTLVPEGNPLIGHAETSTQTAKQLGAKFSGPDQIKARIHAWLAWQAVPGLPYGAAIKAQYFRHDSPPAAVFVRWFKELYRIA